MLCIFHPSHHIHGLFALVPYPASVSMKLLVALLLIPGRRHMLALRSDFQSYTKPPGVGIEREKFSLSQLKL